jgi:hypothetical protein
MEPTTMTDNDRRWSLDQLNRHLTIMAKDAMERHAMEQHASDWRRRLQDFVKTLPPDE